MSRFHQNTYFKEHSHRKIPKHQNQKECRLSPKLKWYLKFFVVLVTFGTTFGLLFFHPFFSIRVVSISGEERIAHTEIQDTIDGILQYKKYYLFPQNNYFLTNLNDLHDILMQRYPLKKLVITKTFPHTLEIELEERISKVIYDNAEQYALVDERGSVGEILRIVNENEWKIVTRNVTTTNEQGEEIMKPEIISRHHTPAYKQIREEVGDYPVVYDTREKTTKKGEQIIEPETIMGILEWYEYLKNESDIPVTYFYLEQELGDVTIKTAEGWVIKAKLNENIRTQFETMIFLLEKKIQRPNFQYIDVRFSGKVFWL